MNMTYSSNQTILSVELLESQLVQDGFEEFVATLAASRGNQSADLTDLIGDQLDDVLSKGLSAIDEQQIQSLVDHPATLLTLHDAIAIDGGDYWFHLAQRHTEPSIQSQDQTINASLVADEASEGSSHQRPQPTNEQNTASMGVNHFLAAIAAALMLAVGLLAYPQLRQSTNSDARVDARIAFATTTQMDSMTPQNWDVHLAAGMLQLRSKKAGDQNETEFADRLATATKACMMVFRHDLNVVPGDSQVILREKCANWMREFAAVAVGEASLSDRSEQLDKLLIRIASGIRKLNSPGETA